MVLLTLRWLVVALLFSSCSRPFFLPMSEYVFDPNSVGIVSSNVEFKTEDGEVVTGWWLPAQVSESLTAPHGTILHLHGNAENISTHISSVYWLPKAGYSVLMLDYRGFGRSSGSPSFAGVQLDVQAALSYLIETRKVQGPIFLLGQSIGGAIGITALARSKYKDHICAAIIESPFSSYRKIAREKLAELWLTWPFQLPLSFVVPDNLSPINYIRDLAPIPLVLIHSSDDPIVSPLHSALLYERASSPKEFWEIQQMGHISAFRSKYFQYLLSETLERFSVESTASARCNHVEG